MKKTLTFICRQKINFILKIFFEILQKCCKIVILGTLVMPVYPYPKWYHQLVQNLCIYLKEKNQLHSTCFSGNIAKICKICKLLILGILGVSGYFGSIVHSILEILHFKESCNFWPTAFWPITQEPELCQIFSAIFARN